MRYSPKRKEAVLRKMMPPYNRPIKQLAEEEGIQILQRRHAVYEKAKSQNRNRWSGTTRSWDYIDHVWLNPPKGKSDEDAQIAA